MCKLNFKLPIIIPEKKTQLCVYILKIGALVNIYYQLKCIIFLLIRLKIILKFFLLNIQPNRNIIIFNNDLQFLNKCIKYEEINSYLDYNFSKYVLKIKILQHQNIIQLYKLIIKQN